MGAALGEQGALIVQRAGCRIDSGNLGIGARQGAPQSQYLQQDFISLAVGRQWLAGIAACGLVLGAGDHLACCFQYLEVLVGRRRCFQQRFGHLYQRRMRARDVGRVQLLQQIETGGRVGKIHVCMPLEKGP